MKTVQGKDSLERKIEYFPAEQTGFSVYEADPDHLDSLPVSSSAPNRHAVARVDVGSLWTGRDEAFDQDTFHTLLSANILLPFDPTGYVTETAKDTFKLSFALTVDEPIPNDTLLRTLSLLRDTLDEVDTLVLNVRSNVQQLMDDEEASDCYLYLKLPSSAGWRVMSWDIASGDDLPLEAVFTNPERE